MRVAMRMYDAARFGRRVVDPGSTDRGCVTEMRPAISVVTVCRGGMGVDVSESVPSQVR